MKGKNVLFAVTGGLFLALAFPTPNITLLSLCAVTLLLFALQEPKSLRKTFFTGFIWGVTFFGGLLYWVVGTVHTFGKLPVIVALLAYLLLIAYLALYPALFALFVRLVKEKLNSDTALHNGIILFALPSVWVLLELIRGTFPFGGFPWGEIGYSWVGYIEWVQIAEFTSVSGVSFLVVFVNVLIYQAVSRFLDQNETERKKGALFLLLGVGVLAGNHFLGASLMQKEAEKPVENSVKVGLLQGNIAQDVKWDLAFRNETLRTYFRLQNEGVRQGAELIVWPETSVPLYLLKYPQFLSMFYDEAEMQNVHLIVGTPDYLVKTGTRNYPVTNTALFFRPGVQELERYDKTHLVPFGEYVPMQEWLPFIDKLVEEVGNFAAGSGTTLFQNGGYRIAPFICFEVIFPEEVRLGVQKGANLIAHLTNDAWFGDSSAPYQHVEIVQMRSIENRVPSITAANTGVTNVILATGEIAAQTELLTEAVLVEEIALRSVSRTFYGQNGQVFLYVYLLIVCVTGFFCFQQRKTKPVSD